MEEYISLAIVNNINGNIECKDKDLLYVKNKHWAPIKGVLKIVIDYCKKNGFKNILEIGPGYEPFPLAKKIIGFNEEVESYISIDIDEDKLPFNDDHFNFIYCRHTIEDIQNPTFALREMFRTTQSGYIETPSPLVEIIKGVDGPPNSTLYGGYIHHRYLVWSDIKENTIYLLPKYSCIIDTNFIFNIVDIKKYLNLINNYPIYWNNYFIWKNQKPKIVMYKNGINFGLIDIQKEYVDIIKDAVNKSIENTNYFINTYLNHN